jgi:hypothetical protein
MPDWTHLGWKDADETKVRTDFEGWGAQGSTNLGISLGTASRGLIDVDVDLGVEHLGALREIAAVCLPWTPMRSGRAGNPDSHLWYQVEGDDLPSTRRYKTHDKKVIIELRSSGAQTMIPPSVHDKTDDLYEWVGEPWGGDEGPATVHGAALARQVALFALVAHLYYVWPKGGMGARHDAYLALAGGLLRYGDGVHPLWERNIAVVIDALAAATRDSDGARTRIAECVDTTVDRLRAGQPAQGWPSLAEHVGDDERRTAVTSVRRLVAECERLAGWAPAATAGTTPTHVPSTEPDEPSRTTEGREAAPARSVPGQPPTKDMDLAPAPIDPMGERLSTWQAVELDAYLSGLVEPPSPSVLERDDGQCLMYGGRVNMLYGPSESAKTWVALWTSMQEMAQGGRVVYLDFEDDPVLTVERLRLMGAGDDDLRRQFRYVRPEEPLAPMQRDRWGKVQETDRGKQALAAFRTLVDDADPTLVVADGMTSLYSLHGLDTNDSAATEVIASWLKSLTRHGKTTAIVIDHIPKNAQRGALPIGSQHKVAFVGGTLLQVWPVDDQRPGRGTVGKVELLVLKDRPGIVREHSSQVGDKIQTAAVVVIDSRSPQTTLVTVTDAQTAAQMVAPPSTVGMDMSNVPSAARAAAGRESEEKVKWAFGGDLDLEMTMRDIVQACDQPEQSTRSAVRRLVGQGWVAGAKKGNRTVYTLQIGGAGYE